MPELLGGREGVPEGKPVEYVGLHGLVSSSTGLVDRGFEVRSVRLDRGAEVAQFGDQLARGGEVFIVVDESLDSFAW